MKICFISIEYNGRHGGGGLGSYIYTMAQQFIEMGHSVIVLCKGQKMNIAMQDGVEVHRMPLSNIHYYFSKIPILKKLTLFVRELEWSFAFARELNHILRKQSVHIVESSETGNFWALLMMRKKVPWVIRCHGSTYSFNKFSGILGIADRLDRSLQIFSLKKASRITVPSNFQAKEISKEITRKHLKVIPNPISPFFLDAPLKVKNPGSVKKILYTGRLAKVKGIEVLIEAASFVCAKNKNVEFILAGPHHSSLNSKRLHDLIHSFAISEQVKLIGRVPWEKTIKLYQQCDIFVMPSFFESFCIAVGEAMALGKPIVACRAGALPEIISENKDGILVEPGNARQLSEALCKLLNDDELCRKMGKAGREKVNSLYSPQVVAQKTLAFYQGIVSENFTPEKDKIL